MIRDELKSLFEKDVECFAHNGISALLLADFDNFILENITNNLSKEIITVYNRFQPMKQQAPDSMKTVLFFTLSDYAKDETSKGNYLNALILYRFLMVKSALDSADYLSVARNLQKLGDTNLYTKFLEIYSEKENNKLLSYIELGNFYKGIKDYQHAIDCYEKFIEADKTKISVFTVTADLYSKLNGSDSLERQIELYKHAYELQNENRLALHGLAFGYEKLGDNEKAKIYYEKLIQTNPTENDLYNYGGFLIHYGDFINGHRYFTHRFNIDDINLEYPSDENKKWDLNSNISDKVLLVHYEQGFGDSIMYSRFVPLLKNTAQKVIFVVQNELFDLISNSEIFKDIEIITNEKDVNYDVNMSLIDAVYVLKTQSTNLPYTSKYLDVPEYKMEQYAKKYLEDKGIFNIGISLSGSADANYGGRDVSVPKIYNILKDTLGIKLFNLQKTSEDCEGLIPLGDTFTDFMQSACAIKNMDLIISTDNVILNLAGALGVQTIGLFNKETNYRWFKTDGDNVGWYDSVKPIQALKQNNWDYVITALLKEIKTKIPA